MCQLGTFGETFAHHQAQCIVTISTRKKTNKQTKNNPKKDNTVAIVLYMLIEGDHWRRVSCKLIKLLSLCLLVLWFHFFFTLTGIRSQSKPNDIMGEVYRAMMSLGYVSAILGDFLTHSLDSTAFSPTLLSLSFLISLLPVFVVFCLFVVLLFIS